MMYLLDQVRQTFKFQKSKKKRKKDILWYGYINYDSNHVPIRFKIVKIHEFI
jgi:hypothetical protein